MNTTVSGLSAEQNFTYNGDSISVKSFNDGKTDSKQKLNHYSFKHQTINLFCFNVGNYLCGKPDITVDVSGLNSD